MEWQRHDLICAVATPFGEGAIAVLRLSGKGCWEVLRSLLKPYPEKVEARRFYLSSFTQQGKVLDEGGIIFFEENRSYTGEAMAELYCHGGRVAPRRVKQALHALGFREAEPGEFTQRRFLSGKVDLVQSEGLLQIVRARTERAQEEAIKMWQGKGSRVFKEIRDEIVDLLACIEVGIDYPEEASPALGQEKLVSRLQQLQEKIAAVLKSWQGSLLLNSGMSVAIVGPPNSGKSTLFNALCSKEKAIVAPLAGTTRDVLEHTFEIRGVPVILKDTAGLQNTTQQLDLLGVAKAKEAIQESELLLWVFDVTSPVLPEIEKLSWQKICLIANKIDCQEDLSSFDAEVIFISALQQKGIDKVRKKIESAIEEQMRDLQFFLTERQKQLLQKMEQDLNARTKEAEQGIPEDVIALALRAVLQDIADLTGENASEEFLAHLFSHFCVGK